MMGWEAAGARQVLSTGGCTVWRLIPGGRIEDGPSSALLAQGARALSAEVEEELPPTEGASLPNLAAAEARFMIRRNVHVRGPRPGLKSAPRETQ